MSLQGQYTSDLEGRQANTNRDLRSSCGATRLQISEGQLIENGLPRHGEDFLPEVGSSVRNPEMTGEMIASTLS